MSGIKTLKKRSYDAKEAFQKGKILDVVVIKDYNFSIRLYAQFVKKQTFHDVELLVPGDRGRVERSGSKYGYDKDTFSALVESRYLKYAKYIQDVINSMYRRFEPWQKWLITCEEVFDFGNELRQQ